MGREFWETALRTKLIGLTFTMQRRAKLETSLFNRNLQSENHQDIHMFKDTLKPGEESENIC